VYGNRVFPYIIFHVTKLSTFVGLNFLGKSVRNLLFHISICYEASGHYTCTPSSAFNCRWTINFQ